MRKLLNRERNWSPKRYWSKYGFSYIRLDELSTECAGLLKEYIRKNDLFMPDVTIESVYDAAFSWDFESWLAEVRRAEGIR